MKPARQVIAVGIVIIGVSAAMVVLTLALLRNGRIDKPQVPVPGVPVPPAAVRVKAVERKADTVERGKVAAASDAVAIVCGMDEATADRYEARNDALRSIARRRDLPKEDVAALMDYLASTNDVLRVERMAALKNDVMNLLRNQKPPAEGLAETLISMFDGKAHPPVVLDYCVQHLGAMLASLDDAMRRRVRETLARAAREKRRPYAGTALYSLADDKSATAAQEGELRRLTVALCKPDACTSARIAAIQLAGQRGYSEVLPILRDTLSGARRDAVLDIVAIGSVGLLGNADDLALLERFASDSRRAPAANAAIRRIQGRTGERHTLQSHE